MSPSKSRPSRLASPTRAVAAALLLAGLGSWAWFGGRAYARVRRDEAAFARAESRKTKTLDELRADEDARLRSGPIPIEEAMRRLAVEGRTGLGAALQPIASSDTAPLLGWAFQPHDVPEWVLAAPPPRPAPSASASSPKGAAAPAR